MTAKKVSAKIDPKDQNKAIVAIGYKQFVMGFDAALAVMKSFEEAEFYDTKWHSAKGDAESYTTHHIGTMDADVFPKLSVMPSALYHVAKVAGPYEDE